MVGQTYGALRVMTMLRAKGKTICKCECLCGENVFVTQGNLRNGHTTSCGCRIHAGLKHATHGMSGTPEYKSYHHAKARCENPNNEKYPSYGARGILFEFDSFEEFFLELGPKPGLGYSVERINNDGHYTPGNIRWATAKEQANNRRPRSRSIIHALTTKSYVVK